MPKVSELIKQLKSCDQDAYVELNVGFKCSKAISEVREKEGEIDGKLVKLVVLY